MKKNLYLLGILFLYLLLFSYKILITSDIPVQITKGDNTYYFIIIFVISIFFIRFSKFILNNKGINKIYILMHFSIIFIFGFIFIMDLYGAIKYNYSVNGTILSSVNLLVLLIHIGIILKAFRAALKG